MQVQQTNHFWVFYRDTLLITFCHNLLSNSHTSEKMLSHSFTVMLLFVAICCGLMAESNAFFSNKYNFVSKRQLSAPSMVLNANNAFSKILPLLVSGAVFLQAPNVIAEDFVPPKYDKVASWEKGIQYSVVKEGRGSTIKVGV